MAPSSMPSTVKKEKKTKSRSQQARYLLGISLLSSCESVFSGEASPKSSFSVSCLRSMFLDTHGFRRE
jgi:hypothetical protein